VQKQWEGVSPVANQEHVDLLMQGVDAWNTWREGHPDSHLDLGGAILVSANLSGVNLSGANLTDADLMDADLTIDPSVEN
jgi:uncharacterized protein YjbI with pentapeptide repeats